jgi:hypothetical protein
LRLFPERRFRLARRWSNRELRTLAPRFGGHVVNVSGWNDEDKEGGTYKSYFSAASAYTLTNYAGERGFGGREGERLLDLSQAPADELERAFDVVFNHTTLEHIFEVRRAFTNLCRLSRDVVIVVVPFAQQQHETASFGDYWRFTPSCLRQLFAENGLTVVYEAESPHADAASYLLFVGARDPERWRTVLPARAPLGVAGRWIGRPRVWNAAALALGLLALVACFGLAWQRLAE